MPSFASNGYLEDLEILALLQANVRRSSLSADSLYGLAPHRGLDGPLFRMQSRNPCQNRVSSIISESRSSSASRECNVLPSLSGGRSKIEPRLAINRGVRRYSRNRPASGDAASEEKPLRSSGTTLTDSSAVPSDCCNAFLNQAVRSNWSLC